MPMKIVRLRHQLPDVGTGDSMIRLKRKDLKQKGGSCFNGSVMRLKNELSLLKIRVNNTFHHPITKAQNASELLLFVTMFYDRSLLFGIYFVKYTAKIKQINTNPQVIIPFHWISI